MPPIVVTDMKHLAIILMTLTAAALPGCEASRSLETAQKTQALKPVARPDVSLNHPADSMADERFRQTQVRVSTSN